MLDANNMRLVPFVPGSLIELDDPLSGTRRLVLVCDTGTEFVDYLDADKPATPLAILDTLDPKWVGDDGDWAYVLMESGQVDQWYAFRDLATALFDTPVSRDKLTRCRAAYHAYKSGDYNLSKAVDAGLRADAEARARQAQIADQASALVAAGML